MQKPADLRAYLVRHLPDLNQDPETIRIWIEEGTVKTTQTASRGFELRYKLNVALIDVTFSPLVIFLHINDWLRVNQPDLVASQAAAGYEMAAEVQTNDRIDLGLTLPLTEAISYAPREDGGWDLISRPEPPCFDEDLMAGPPPLLKELWWRGEPLLPHDLS